ncbi:outer membrane protein (OmpH-like) [mine drainage metagenome]|uniref:Outer membrane protein (OmpH-like) n=1 Tax=mine drainage metagenome TaxID=410659 RepID=A0A1J5RFP5_9ZZZZ
MVIRSRIGLLLAGCMTVALFAAPAAWAEDNGFGVGNSGEGAAPVALPASGSTAPAAPHGAAPAHGILSPVVGVVDVDYVMSHSEAAKSVAAQRQKWQKTYQTDLSKEDASLRATKQKLEQERASMSPEVFQGKARDFEQTVGEFQRKVMQRSRALDKSYAIAMSRVERTMVEVTAKVAGEHHINLVMPRSQVLLFADAMNISQEVVDGLNRKLPKVDMPAPKLEPVAVPGAGQE